MATGSSGNQPNAPKNASSSTSAPLTGSMWTLLSGNQYDPAKVYSKSTDNNGHYRQARVKLPPELLAETEAFVASRVVSGYRTVEDALRDGLLHRMKFWHDYSGAPLTPIYTSYMFGADIAREAALYESWQEHMDNSIKLAEKMIAVGDLERCSEFLQSAQDKLEFSDMPELLKMRFADDVAVIWAKMRRFRQRDLKPPHAR